MVQSTITLGLVTEENGSETIEGRLGPRKLSLRQEGQVYQLRLSDGASAIQRSFEHWRSAALAFAMLYHTERSLLSLGGQG